MLVTRRLPAAAMLELERRCRVDAWEGEGAMPRPELLARVPSARGLLSLLTDRVDEEVLEAAPDLRVVANYAVGFDNVDVPACTRRGVLVTNTPDVLTEATADMAWALLLAAARGVARGDRFLRTGAPWAWGPEMMLGREVHGRTLGIVGLGRIGRAVARRAAGFGMRVVYHGRTRAPEEVEAELGVAFLPFGDLLAEADLVTVHVSLDDRTRHLFDAEAFRRMKPTAVLVNTSRGPVVDETALAEALLEGEIFAAGLDVFEREPEVHPRILEAENAVLVPHLGSATVETRGEMARLAVENLLAGLRGERPPSPVNPEVLA